MPARLFSSGFPDRTDVRRQGQTQERSAFSGLARSHTIRSGAPWEGLTADLPHESDNLQFVKSTSNLVAKPDPAGSGEILMNDVGFEEVDSARLPLGSADGRVVVHISQFPLLDVAAGSAGTPVGSEDTQAIVLVAGDGSTGGSFKMYRLDPASAQWTEINYSTAGGASGTFDPSATRDGDQDQTESLKSMPDSCVFFGGAPSRGDLSGNIDQPAFVWTNNSDPVMVYPRTDGTLDFEPLTATLGATTEGPINQDFRCMSLETFGDRVYFLNTWEDDGGGNGRRFQNRLRRTARGTCDPTPAVGSGFIDLDTFSGAGLRVETLGNVLACYFQDGVAFIRETGLANAPNAVQILDTKRGLLGTHAVTPIGNNLHFGIFDDGWWFLDSSGRWREAGVTAFEGKPVEKWRRSFYKLIDPLNTHRIHTFFDRERNWVRIVVPQPSGDTTSTRETTVTWVYDLDADRVWTLNYPESYNNQGGVTVWSELIQRDTSGETWNSITGTWSNIDQELTWADLGPEKGHKRLCHGNHTGYVYAHNEELIQHDGQDPVWSYEVISSDLGRPRSLKTVDRIGIEHVNSSNAVPVTITALNAKGDSVSGSASLDQGDPRDVEIADQWFRQTGEHVGFSVEGSGPVRIRSFEVDLIEDGVERRR